MTEEHLQGYPSQGLLSEPKRRRIPSQYAAQIADLKSNHTPIPKKLKTLRFLDSEKADEDNPKESASNRKLCILPSGKRYLVKIVGGTIKNRKIEKPQKNKQAKRQIQAVAAKDQLKKESSQSFFDKLRMVCEQLQRKDDHDSKQPAQNSKENEEKSLIRRQDKIRKEKERDDRWNKFYQRFRVLTERLDKLQDNYIFLG